MKLASLAVPGLTLLLLASCDTHGVDLGRDAYVRQIDLDALPADLAPLPDLARLDVALQVLDSGPPIVPPDLSALPPPPDGEVDPSCFNPVAEVCNGRDDNCDHRIDEGTIIGTTCWPRREGCLVETQRVCDEGGTPTCVAAPEMGCRESPLVFAFLSDYGGGTRGEGLISDLVRSWNPSFVITGGDNNLPDGGAETIDRNVGQYFGSFIGNYQGAFGEGSEDNRFWPALGHVDWQTEGAQPYLDFFTLPGNERYYEVDLGVVHLFVLDSDPKEPDGNTIDSVQGQWFEAAAARSRACLKLVAFHHPPYTSAARGEMNGGVPMRWPFAAAGIGAVLSGHDRFYERLEVDAVPYFIVAYAGAGQSHTFAETPHPASQLRYRERQGALKVTVSASDATFEFFNIGGELIDSVVRPLSCPQ